jgi:hypothetical protein
LRAISKERSEKYFFFLSSFSWRCGTTLSPYRNPLIIMMETLWEAVNHLKPEHRVATRLHRIGARGSAVRDQYRKPSQVITMEAVHLALDAPPSRLRFKLRATPWEKRFNATLRAIGLQRVSRAPQDGNVFEEVGPGASGERESWP